MPDASTEVINPETGIDPQMSLNDQDIDNLKDWGVNAVRLGVMWQALEIGLPEDCYDKKTGY